MKLLTFVKEGKQALGVKIEGGIVDLEEALNEQPNEKIPTNVMEVIEEGEEVVSIIEDYISKLPNDASYIKNEEELLLGPCVTQPNKIICVGLNYRKHADESNMPYPEVPILFNKFNNALTGHKCVVAVPKMTEMLDYEGELGVVIGKEAKFVSKENALDYVFGYCTANDLSARDLQMRTGQWMVGKACDDFCPVGPYLVTADEAGDPNMLQIKTIGYDILNYFDYEDVSFGKKLMHNILDHPHQPIRHQIKFKHKDGSIRWCDVAFTNYLDDPHIQGIVFNLKDFTKQKEATDIVNRLANYDYLTNLPNRRHFEFQLNETIIAAKANHSRVAVLFLDLDGFKNINDTLGHEVGDGLLKEVGHRIISIMKFNAFVGRLGGDEFAIIIPNIGNYEQLLDIADELIQSFCLPFTVGEYELNVSASAGISIYPVAGNDVRSLIKNADIAMYEAKHHGKNHCQIYDPSMGQNSYKTFLLKNDLKKALENEQFFMVYQPRIEPQTKKIVGAEALIRWSHPELGFVSQLEFIHFAEESGFIIPLGAWILRNVCKQIKDWQQQGLSPIKVSVNISVMQLMHLNFVPTIKKILAETDLNPKWLEFEINERVLFQKEKQVNRSLEEIKNIGISLALDNFGTGYSALNYISKHKFDVIKIDRTIIEDIQNGDERFEIAMSIVKLAQKLNKNVVAGGIETATQLDLITEMGFNEFQGFYFSKPIEKNLFEELLKQ